MERVEIKTSLTLADWQAYQRNWAQRNFAQGIRFGGALVSAGVIFSALVLSHYLHRPLSMPSVIVGILFVTLGSYFDAKRARRAAHPDPDGSVLGPCTFVLSDAGIEVVKAGVHAHYSWSVVKDLAWTTERLFVWTDRVAAMIVPLRDLPAGISAAQLNEAVSAVRAALPSGITIESARPLPPAETSSAVLEAAVPHEQESWAPASSPFKRFMRAYGALLLGRTPAANDLELPSRFLLLFPVVGFVLWFVADRLRAGTDATFFSYALFSWSWYAVVLLGSLWVASRLVQPRAPYERILALTAAFLPVVLALELAQEQWVREDWMLVTSMAIAFYVALYVSRTLRSLTGGPQGLAARTFAVILFVAVWATHSMYFSGHFWYADDDSDEEGSEYWADMERSEALMYAQSKRIDAAVQALRRPDDLGAAAFFVGFAGQGDQHVFASEISLARKVVAAKFGSAERSVLLVNDQRDLNTLPLASPTALRYALSGIAARMRLDRDVLFLSLSSHGSKEGEIMVSNGMLELNDLSADDLAAALRESGIKWKVIVVSACYAAKFIEPLRDDSTIIIAAAAADRTSFGCSDDRDLTYFGEAFYRDALPSAPDLKTAFEKAAAEIAAREKAEKITASNPQAHFGRALVEHLQSDFPSD